MTLLERRYRGHRLERRADGLGLRDGTVDHRVVGALPGQLLVVLRADPPDPDAGVVGRVARHAEDLAVPDVEDDGRAAVGRVLAVLVRQRDARPQRLLGGRLHVDVEGGDEGVARLRHAAAHGLGLLGPAVGVHLDAGDPVAAAQPRVVGVLQTVLADHVAGRVPLEVLILELIGIDLAEMAQQLRRHVALRIGAQVLVADLHAGEVQRVLLQVRAHALAHVLLHHDQVEAGDVAVQHLAPREEAGPRAVLVLLHRARPQVVHDLLADLARAHLEHPRQALYLRVELPLRHGHEADADSGPRAVLHEHLALAVDDVAARRDHLDRAQTVVVGLGDELLAAQDLQEPEAEEDDAEQHRGQAEDDRHAQGDGGELDDGLVAAAGPDGPVAAVGVTSEQRHAGHLPLSATPAPADRPARRAAC